MIKRLEEGTFAWPRSVDEGATKLRLAPEALAMLTDMASSCAGRGCAHGMIATN